MKRKACIILLVLALSACSTTRLLPEGEYRLASNKIEVSGDGKLGSADLSPYLRQQSNNYLFFGWNPFLNVYNWSNGKGNGWDRFVRKIGVAPVVYDPDLVVWFHTEDRKSKPVLAVEQMLRRQIPVDAFVPGDGAAIDSSRITSVTLKLDGGGEVAVDNIGLEAVRSSHHAS